MQELQDRNLLSTNQHATRGEKGTEIYFAELNELLETHYPKDHHIYCAILDLSKAFDRTWRHTILERINMWGFGGRITAYLQIFLSNHTFKILIATTSSDFHVQENGVPQGAILSPTLFLISVEFLCRPCPVTFNVSCMLMI